MGDIEFTFTISEEKILKLKELYKTRDEFYKEYEQAQKEKLPVKMEKLADTINRCDNELNTSILTEVFKCKPLTNQLGIPES